MQSLYLARLVLLFCTCLVAIFARSCAGRQVDEQVRTAPATPLFPLMNLRSCGCVLFWLHGGFAIQWRDTL